MSERRVEGGPLLLILMERLIGFILLVTGIILLYGAYTSQAGLGGAAASLFITMGVALIILGIIMLISRISES